MDYHIFNDCPCGHIAQAHGDECVCLACPSDDQVIAAADAFATAFETNVTWRNPFDYEGVARSRKAVAQAFADYLKARGKETMLP